MYKVPIIIRVSQSSKTTAMQQMLNGLEIRISQRGRFPPRETLKWEPLDANADHHSGIMVS
jgi:hypothetical protein